MRSVFDLIPRCPYSRHTLDMGALAVLTAALSGWIPAITAVLTAVWIGLRAYQTWLEIKIMKKNGHTHVRRKEDLRHG